MTDLVTAPVTTPNMAPVSAPVLAHNIAPVLAHDMAPVSAHDMAPVSAHDMAPMPASHMVPIPASDMVFVSAHDMASIPASNMVSIPASDMVSVSSHDMASIPASNMVSIPASDMASVLDHTLDQDGPDKVFELDPEIMAYYRALRSDRIDPITMCPISNPDVAFCYSKKWDPYTGEALAQEDPDGPLYFDPDVLIHTFYVNRYRKLWVPSEGQYEGYFDDAVGIGPYFEVPGRGSYPEWYVFRLPIIDCYLYKDHDQQIVTMGPKLTMTEIRQIAQLAAKSPSNYTDLFQSPRPDLRKMKILYDISISDCVDSIETNQRAVNQLVKM